MQVARGGARRDGVRERGGRLARTRGASPAASPRGDQRRRHGRAKQATVSGASVIVVGTRLGVGHCRSFNVGCVREPAKLRRGEMPMESVLVLFPR